MNKRNMERCINNWVLCPSKSFPGKFYYFNVLTGEAAWTLGEMENTRAMPKNSYIQKVNRWHTYPEPESPPDDRYMPEPSWRRKHDQSYSSRPAMPRFGQPAFPVYHPYMEPLPNIMQNLTPMGSVFMGDLKRHTEFQNVWGRDRDSYFPNMDMDKRFVRYEKPMFNETSTPIKSQWPYNYQRNSAVPIFGQTQSKITPRWFVPKPRANVIKEPIFGHRRSLSDSSIMDYEENLFKTKSFNNVQSVDDSSCFLHSRPSEQTNTKFTPKSSVFQTGRLFGTKSYENLKTLDDSCCFEMPKAKSSIQKNIFKTEPERNIKVTKHVSNENMMSSLDNLKTKQISNKNVSISDNLKTKLRSNENLPSIDNLKSSLTWLPRKRPQSVLTGQARVNDTGNIDAEKLESLHELGENDLRYILMAKRKKLDRPQGGKGNVVKQSDTAKLTGNKVKTSYTKTNVVTPTKKRVTFDIDFSSDNDEELPGDGNELPGEDEEMPGDTQPEDDKEFDDEEACEEGPLDIKALKSLAKPQARTDVWFIVMDTEVLLEDYEFIINFVQADSKCHLLIPIAVRHQLDAMTVGDCRGRQRVMAARQLARKMASPPGCVIVQTAEEYTSDISVSDSILNCCLQAMEQRCHVVLITNDETLCKKANLIDIPCFTLQEIKDGAAIPKPEISFDIRKIINSDTNKDAGRKNLFPAVSTTANRLSLNRNSEISVKCFKKRLFNVQKTKNTKGQGLFLRNDERNVINDSNDIIKTNQTAKTFADCEKFQTNEIFAPKNYRDCPKELSDTSANSSEIRQIQTNIQNLIIDEVPRNIIIQKKSRLPKPDIVKDKPKNFEELPKVLDNNEARTEEVKDITKKKKLKSINGYTIEQHLKKFDVKTKVVEDRIKTRMDEWICSFSQIMEDILTYILQDYIGTQSALTPPWTLAEAVECLRDVYGDNSSVRIIVEKLSGLLFNCSCKKGKLNLNMKPKDFMTIFGLGILLIQCLKNVIPTQQELTAAEEALLSLLQLVTESGVEPASPEPAPAPSGCTSAELPDRKNFVKKPSEVIEYLQRHYPEWQSYRETDEATLQQEMDQLKEKGKRLNKIVRTVGKDLHNLKIDNKKGISFATKTNNVNTGGSKNDEHSHSNDVLKAKKAKVNNIDDKIDEIETESACDRAIKATGAKLLRKLATNSLNKLPKLQNIDVEKRDKSGKELVDMIDNMTGKTNENKTADFNDGNNNTDQVNNENLTIANKETKIVRTFGNFAIVKINSCYPNDRNKTNPAKVVLKDNNNDTKKETPKIIRNFNVTVSTKDKNNKSDEMLDLDALDYDMDHSEDDEHDDTSQMTIDNDENHNEVVCDDVEKNREAKQTEGERPQNDNGNAEEQINENVETDTTNDSGFENDSLHAYTLAKTCLTEISETLKSVYRFVSSTAAKFRMGHLDDDARAALHQKTGESRKMLTDIIDCLKRIIARESDERTSLRAALIKAGGAEACGDKRIVRYKQVVSKYLEQARILEEALHTVLAATATRQGNSPGTVSSPGSNIKYINIFE